jgi:hypothetical protein
LALLHHDLLAGAGIPRLAALPGLDLENAEITELKAAFAHQYIDYFIQRHLYDAFYVGLVHFHFFGDFQRHVIFRH